MKNLYDILEFLWLMALVGIFSDISNLISAFLNLIELILFISCDFQYDLKIALVLFF